MTLNRITPSLPTPNQICYEGNFRDLSCAGSRGRRFGLLGVGRGCGFRDPGDCARFPCFGRAGIQEEGRLKRITVPIPRQMELGPNGPWREFPRDHSAACIRGKRSRLPLTG